MTQLSSTRQAEKNGRRSDVARADNYDWSAIRRALGESGNAVLPKLLDARQSKQVSALYPSDELYRTRIVMARHGFGRGEYKYFRYPLPDLLQSLRSALYPHLARIANHWNEVLGDRERFPSSHEEYLQRCHRAGQTRPTPVRRGRLQLPASGSVWRSRLPLASRHLVVPTECRLRRW